jgi:hypothetical protein
VIAQARPAKVAPTTAKATTAPPTRRFRSPVSYWEVDHHARAFQVTESVALALFAARARGPERLGLGVALVFAALPLLHDNAHGLPGFAGLRDRVRPRAAVPLAS